MRNIPVEKINFEPLVLDRNFQKNIQEYGVQQDILLSKSDGGRYDVVYGRRRLNALVSDGRLEINAFVIEKSPEAEAILSLIENMQRSPNPAVEAENIKFLLDKGYDQQRLAGALRVSQSQISKRLLLLKLIPLLFSKLKSGKLKPSIARELAKMPQEKQAMFAERERITLKDVRGERREEILASLDLSRAEDFQEDYSHLIFGLERAVEKAGKKDKAYLKKAINILGGLKNGGL